MKLKYISRVSYKYINIIESYLTAAWTSNNKDIMTTSFHDLQNKRGVALFKSAPYGPRLVFVDPTKLPFPANELEGNRQLPLLGSREVRAAEPAKSQSDGEEPRRRK